MQDGLRGLFWFRTMTQRSDDDVVGTPRRPRLTPIVCPTCDGWGYLYEGGMSMNDEYNNRVECPTCETEGEIDGE
jgi:DnaJ-class molecular chaperone